MKSMPGGMERWIDFFAVPFLEFLVAIPFGPGYQCLCEGLFHGRQFKLLEQSELLNDKG